MHREAIRHTNSDPVAQLVDGHQAVELTLFLRVTISPLQLSLFDKGSDRIERRQTNAVKLKNDLAPSIFVSRFRRASKDMHQTASMAEY